MQTGWMEARDDADSDNDSRLHLSTAEGHCLE
jgi:hypothetical protein